MKKKPVTKLAETDDIKQLTPQENQEFIKTLEETENLGNAMYATAQEFMLVIEDALIRYHDFSEDDIKQLHEEIKPVLGGVAEFERAGLSLLSTHDIGIVAEIVQTRLIKERAWRKGQDTPILSAAKPFLKVLKKKNNDK